MAKQVYMGYECSFGVKVTPEAEDYTDFLDITSVDYSSSVEKDEWYAFRDKGKKTSIVTGREDSVSVTTKALKDDVALKYCVLVGMTKSGSDAQVQCKLTIPTGFTIEGAATVELSNPGTGDANAVPDVEINFTFSGDYTITKNEE